ncbi:MAG: 16S rRNA (adenine(1518)-N(6)/adenine(1519)-N(6))-dimethyltransferase RsmA [Thermogutta sp.]
MASDDIPRQTLSFLRERLAAAGIRPKTDLGQNFLIDLNLLRVLVEKADVSSCDVILEIGSGTGSLTSMLAERAAYIVSVEIDPRLHALAQQFVGQKPNVCLLRQDALKGKNRLHPQLVETITEALSLEPQRRLKLVANLPYNVATPVITNLLALPVPPVSMTATIQREVAERIVAQPCSKDYGALSVWVQSQCRARIERIIPPQAFWPRPKVFSAIIHVETDMERRAQIPDLNFFHGFVRGLFLHRRKFLRTQILSVLGREANKEEVDRLLRELGVDPQSRAERLSVEELINLSAVIHDRFPALRVSVTKNRGE